MLENLKELSLRDYQKRAVDKMLWSLQLEGNSIISMAQGCLAKGTPVLMANGQHKNIEKISNGDMVASYDNYTNNIIPNKVNEVIRTCLKPKPMIELTYENETITTTYDHPFFNGKKFYPLYQLIWREMETSERVQLKLLCKQYGSHFNHKKSRGLLSCCNETCSRCKRIPKNSNEWENDKSPQNNCSKLARKSIKSSCNQSSKWNKRRQPSFKSGVVHSEIQQLDWTQNWKNKNTKKPKKKYHQPERQSFFKNLFFKKNEGENMQREINMLQFSTKKIPTNLKIYHSNIRNWKRIHYQTIRIKKAEPYYAICLKSAPHTYIIGKKYHFITHNSGKSHVIAEFVKQYNKPVLILVPSKELLEQDLDKLTQVIDKKEIGVYSASMDSKEIKAITIGTIQSVYKNPEKFMQYKVAIVDECHGINPKHFTGMYNTFFNTIDCKVIGLTATPFRMGVKYRRWGRLSWMLTTITTTKMINRTRPIFWHRMLDVVNIKELQDKGYLVPLTYQDISLIRHEQIPINKTKSEFDLQKFDEMCNDYTKMAQFINKLPHKRTLIFCSSIEQANSLQKFIKNSEVITSETNKKKREITVKDFRQGIFKVLLGVNIFTIGFDVPEIDCIIILRPTKSLVLWTQVLGRGTRTSNGKKTCYVYDFVDNIRNLGTLESLEIKRIDDKWNVATDIKPEGFHNVSLFEYDVKK